MEIKKIIMATPSRLKAQERRALGFVDAINSSIDAGFFDEKTEARLKSTAKKMEEKDDASFLDGRVTGGFFVSLFLIYKAELTLIDNWGLAAENERINYLLTATADAPTAQRLEKYGLADFSTDGMKKLKHKYNIFGAKKSEITSGIGTALGWRALIMAIEKALNLPELRQLANLDNVANTLAKNNKCALKTALFLGHGFLPPDEIDALRYKQTAPLDALQWVPEPDEIDFYADKITGINIDSIWDTYTNCRKRGRALCISKATEISD